jgi:hypothetical protein
MKPITYTVSEWEDVFNKIKEDHPPSVYLIREKMRKKLGFTDRTHKEWVNKINKWGGIGHYETKIHLDFYDEKYKTMFLLKYGTDKL